MTASISKTDLRVRDLMTPSVVNVHSQDTVATAYELMLDHRFRQKRRCKGVQNRSISFNALAIHVAYALSRMAAWGQGRPSSQGSH